eukprot:scaffold7099_cov281-Pinguiococcus_pyrenoidosus.AAC.26
MPLAVSRIRVMEPVKLLVARPHHDAAALRVLVERLDAVLAPNPGVLRASPRGAGVIAVVVVYPNDADVELLGHAMASHDVFRIHDDERTEDLFLHAPHSGFRGDDRWQDEVALGDLRWQLVQRWGSSSAENLRSFALGNADRFQHATPLRFGYHRPHLRRHVHRVPKPDTLCFAHKPLDHLLVDGLVHEESGAHDAGLSRGDEGRERGAIHGLIQVSIFEYQHRRLAAQLADHSRQVRSRDGSDGLSGWGAAGEVHLSHQRVGAKCGARLVAVARDHTEHSVGKASFLADLGQLEHREWRELGRLEDHRVPRGQRGRQLLHRDQQRMIPRSDLRDHAQRNALYIVEIRAQEGSRAAFCRPHQRAEVLKPLGQASKLRLHLADRASSLSAFQLCQLLQSLSEALGDALQHVRAKAHVCA